MKQDPKRTGFMSYSHDPSLRHRTWGRVEPMDYDGPPSLFRLTAKILVVGFLLAYIIWKAFP